MAGHPAPHPCTTGGPARLLKGNVTAKKKKKKKTQPPSSDGRYPSSVTPVLMLVAHLEHSPLASSVEILSPLSQGGLKCPFPHRGFPVPPSPRSCPPTPPLQKRPCISHLTGVTCHTSPRTGLSHSINLAAP